MKLIIILLLSFCYTFTQAQNDPYLLKNIKTHSEVNAVAYSPDGQKILAGFSDGSAEIINLSSGKTEVKVEDHWKGVMAVEMDPNGKYFMTAGDKTIKIWSPEGERIYNLKKHTTTIYSADINPQGTFIVSGAISPAFRYWDVIKGEFIRNISGHTDRTMAVCFNRDGSLVASGSYDHTIKIWKAGSFDEIMELKAHPNEIFALDFSPDGKLLASCSKDKTIRIYDLEKGELLKILNGHRNFVMDIEFAPDSKHLLSCSFDNEIRIWEIATGKNLYSFIDHKAEVTDICFAPDGKSFASASRDKTIKIWEYSNDIFVDFYYSDQIIDEMDQNKIFLPRKKGESKTDYQKRAEKAETLRRKIYYNYFQKYKTELDNKSLPGMK